MPLRVSEWRSSSSVRTKSGASLTDVGLQAVVLQSGTVMRALARTSSDSTRLKPLSAAWFADKLESEACIILSPFADACFTPNCHETMHVIEVEGKFPCNQLCTVVSEPIVDISLQENNVILSNNPSADFRAKPLSRGWLEGIKNVLVVPLFMGESSEAKLTGVFVAANKHGGGFDVNDYVNLYVSFSETAMRLYSRYMENAIATLSTKLQNERTEHYAEMKRLAQSRDTFMATMSHEIRTPLNAVSGYNQLMALGKSRVDLNNCLRKQLDAILQLTQIIANVLDFTKLKSESLRLSVKPFSPHEVLHRCLEMIRGDCDTKKITLDVHETDIPDSVLGDEVRLGQVIMNILTNAVKFTSVGGRIIVETFARKIDSAVELHCSVTDTGRGIPSHLQQEIFQDFSQIRETVETSASVQGVGLGLAICKELVQLMRGSISVESDGHSGSKFSFSVRLSDAKGMSEMVARVKDTYKACPVLIVDDLEVNRMVMTRMFVEWGFRPHACSSIDEAVHVLETFPSQYFHIALIDIDIAGESGLRLARFIAQNPLLSDVLVIAVSSMGQNFPGSDEFDAVHEKPLQSDYMLSDIERLSHTGPRRKLSQPSSFQDDMRSRSGSVSLPRAYSAFKVLLVDDDEPSLTVLREMLISIGCSVNSISTCNSGKTALRILREAGGLFQFVFMDLVMPVMSGIECMRAIKASPSLYGTPQICAVSADAVDRTRLTSYEAGADSFMSKPVSMKELEELIGRVCSKKPSAKKKKKIKGARKLRKVNSAAKPS